MKKLQSELAYSVEVMSHLTCKTGLLTCQESSSDCSFSSFLLLLDFFGAAAKKWAIIIINAKDVTSSKQGATFQKILPLQSEEKVQKIHQDFACVTNGCEGSLLQAKQDEIERLDSEGKDDSPWKQQAVKFPAPRLCGPLTA